MGYKTKIQLIKRKESEQWYIKLPRGPGTSHRVRTWRDRRMAGENRTKLILKRHDPPLTEAAAPEQWSPSWQAG